MILLPPDHPDAPKYWMYEIGGKLRSAVTAYINGEKLDRRQLGLIKAYLRQWVNSPVWGENDELKLLRANVATIETHAHIDYCVEIATALGMDPLRESSSEDTVTDGWCWGPSKLKTKES